MADTVELSLSARPEFVGAIRHVFGALGRLAELPADSVEDLRLAVSEAVTNAITRSADAGDVRVLARRDPGIVNVEIVDSGPEFAIDRETGLDETDPHASFEAGLSLPVVRGLVDELELVPGDGGGMRVRFTVRAEGGPGAE